jgi:hypothetical protein
MIQPVSITIPLDQHREIIRILREAREDLAVYIAADWPEDLRARYPAYQRKWERDMELCWRIDAALAALPEVKE